MVIFAEQKFTEIPVPRICIENATTVPKMKIIMQCNNILMFLQKKIVLSSFFTVFPEQKFQRSWFSKFLFRIPQNWFPRWFKMIFFSKNQENYEKTHSSQILRSWNKVFVKSPILKWEGLNYLFKICGALRGKILKKLRVLNYFQKIRDEKPRIDFL